MSRTAIATAALVALAPLTVLAAPTASSASVTEARAAAPAYKVTAKIDKTEVVAHELVKIKGRVTPSAAGEKIVLQQRRGNQRRWRVSGTSTVRPSGAFVLKDQPTTGGHRAYRVLKPASEGVAKGVSKEMYVAVWAWEALTSRPAGATSGVTLGITTTIATDPYSASVVLTNPGTSGYVEYTLGSECRSLSGTNALTDDSATGAQGRVTVSVDGVTPVAHDLGTGSIGRYTIDVTDAFRIRLDLSGSATPAGRSAVGSPYVLCLD